MLCRILFSIETRGLRHAADSWADVRARIDEGAFEAALALATQRSVECVQSGRTADASSALALAAETLCTLNQPLRGRALALEALDMVTGGDVRLERHVRVVAVLALLRLGTIDKAEAELTTALAAVVPHPRLDEDPLAMIVAAEVALATDAIGDARSFADAAFASAVATGEWRYRAQSLLILGACAMRERRYKAALRSLTAAADDLRDGPHAETAWQVHAALAKVNRKLGRIDTASRHAAIAAAEAMHAAATLSIAGRSCFLKNPTVSSALGLAAASTCWSRLADVATLAGRRDGDAAEGLAPLVEAFRRINAPRNLSDFLPVMVEAMMGLCGARRGTIALFDGDSCTEEVSRAGAAESFQSFEMGVARAVLRIVRESGQPFVADDVRAHPELDVRADLLLSVLCVPIGLNDKIDGAVYLDTPGAAGAFEPRDLEVATILADYGAVALENVRVRDDATRDGLTLLYSQAHVEECLKREIAASLASGRPCGVLMVDIDDFKQTNDGWGHAAGNDLLRALAPMLTRAVRSLDVVARIEARDPLVIVGRYGGDEFEIVLPGTGAEGLAAVAARVLEAVRGAFFAYEARRMSVTVSIGGACFPGDASSARELMQRADDALYQAKKAGKNRYQAYGTE